MQIVVNDYETLVRSLCSVIENTVHEKGRALVGIDGRCAAGKTTLSGLLRERTGCAVIHADDFFLPADRKTAERLAQPGGNFDRERFFREVIEPWRLRQGMTYQKYSCTKGMMTETVTLESTGAVIAEGVYCLHPMLEPEYDVKVFMDIDGAVQERRLRLRDANKLGMYKNVWIPLENEYFANCGIMDLCDFVFSGNKY